MRIRRRWMEAAFATMAMVLAMPVSDARAEEETIYTARCASCHGDDGKAETPIGRALAISSFEGSSFTKEGLAKLLSESTSHSGLLEQLGDGDLDRLVEILNALAAGA